MSSGWIYSRLELLKTALALIVKTPSQSGGLTRQSPPSCSRPSETLSWSITHQDITAAADSLVWIWVWLISPHPLNSSFIFTLFRSAARSWAGRRKWASFPKVFRSSENHTFFGSSSFAKLWPLALNWQKQFKNKPFLNRVIAERNVLKMFDSVFCICWDNPGQRLHHQTCVLDKTSSDADSGPWGCLSASLVE